VTVKADAHDAVPGSARSTRAGLAAELRRLEEAMRRTQGELVALGGERLPGLHLVVSTAGRRALLSTARVVEVVRLVATTPLAGAPPHVLGSFVCRGTPVVAVDLAALLGASREPPLDAQIAVLAGTPAVGLVLDRIERIVDGPRLHDGGDATTPEGWRGSPLLAGLCLDEGEVLPLLDVAPLAALLPERAA
jgi:purine-binding chemotaxis protein CheW